MLKHKFVFLLITICVVMLLHDNAAAAQAVNIDGEGPGRIYEGVGVLSAGASSRLLIDYKEPYRSADS